MSPLKKILMTLMVLGGMGMTISAGTFASFNASTTNTASTFATGSLVLNRELNSSGTLCFSNGTTSSGAGTSTDTNTNSTCTAMINTTTVKLGDAATSVDITIKNAGSLSGTLTYMSGGCTSATNGTYYNGGTSICTNANITIQEYTDAGRLTTKSRCVYPSQASVCPTLSATTSPTYLVGSLPTTLSTPVFGGTDAVLSGDSRFYRLTIQLPNTGLSSADGTQGMKATFALTWSLV